MSTVSARPICAAHVAHGLPGRPRPVRPATARRCLRAHTRAVTAFRARIAARPAVEQGEALEHPRQRGHPLGKWVEAAAHRSFLPTGRVEKSGRRRRSPTRWGLRWPAGSYVGVEREGARLNIPRKKKRQEGAQVPLTVEELTTAEAAGQRRWRAPGMDDGVVRTGVREATTRLEQLGARSEGLSGRRRAVSTAPLRHASGAARARGSHAVTAR
jgi:hypothetical protein